MCAALITLFTEPSSTQLTVSVLAIMAFDKTHLILWLRQNKDAYGKERGVKQQGDKR